VDAEVTLAFSQVTEFPLFSVVPTLNEIGAVPLIALTTLAVCAAGTDWPMVYGNVIVVGVTVTLPLPDEEATVIETLTVCVPVLPEMETNVITPLQVVPLAIPAGFTVTGIMVAVPLATYVPLVTDSQFALVQFVCEDVNVNVVDVDAVMLRSCVIDAVTLV